MNWKRHFVSFIINSWSYQRVPFPLYVNTVQILAKPKRLDFFFFFICWKHLKTAVFEEKSSVCCPLWNNRQNIERYGIVLYGMLLCGPADYQNHKRYCITCFGGLCTRLIYCTVDRVLVQRLCVIIRHVCGCYVFHSLLALWAYLHREQEQECIILKERGSLGGNQTQVLEMQVYLHLRLTHRIKYILLILLLIKSYWLICQLLF